MDTLLPGICAERVPTSRLTVNVLSVPGRTGPPVLLVHGNVSSSLFWQPAPASREGEVTSASGVRVAGGRGDFGIRRPAHWQHGPGT
jgi:hypothetical protein